MMEDGAWQAQTPRKANNPAKSNNRTGSPYPWENRKGGKLFGAALDLRLECPREPWGAHKLDGNRTDAEFFRQQYRRIPQQPVDFAGKTIETDPFILPFINGLSGVNFASAPLTVGGWILGLGVA
jgi:hypothetical protein